ncbi:hypothetical protein ACLOJK_010362 [Asimina triloba]
MRPSEFVPLLLIALHHLLPCDIGNLTPLAICLSLTSQAEMDHQLVLGHDRASRKKACGGWVGGWVSEKKTSPWPTPAAERDVLDMRCCCMRMPEEDVSRRSGWHPAMPAMPGRKRTSDTALLAGVIGQLDAQIIIF